MASATLALFFAATAHSRDLVPEYWLENVEAADGSVQQCLVFPTVKGVRYTVEKSADLTTWEPDESFASGGVVYGMSHECVVALRQYIPPPSGGETPPPGNPKINVTIKLQPSSGPAGGTVASWPSLSGSGSATVVLEQDMHAAWEGVPLYVSGYGDYLAVQGNYRALVWHPPGTTPPPQPTALSAEDLEFRDVLTEAFGSMNDQVAASLAQVRNAPPSLPPAPGSRGFWRIKADWDMDSDGDGSPDWAEFEISEISGHPNQNLANAFDPDADANGIADGLQLDLDLDYRVDAVDIAVSDATVSEAITPRPRYALFPITNAQPPAGATVPLGINNRGRVLYRNGTWSGGAWTALIPSNQASTLTGTLASGMNDLDEIVGVGTYRAQEGPLVEGMHVAFWAAPNADPAPLTNGDMFAALPPQVFAIPAAYNGPGVPMPDRGPFLSNGGQIIVSAYKIDLPPNSPHPNFVPVPGNNRYIWTLPGAGRAPTHIATGSGMSFIKDQTLVWGRDPQTTSLLTCRARETQAISLQCLRIWFPLRVASPLVHLATRRPKYSAMELGNCRKLLVPQLT